VLRRTRGLELHGTTAQLAALLELGELAQEEVGAAIEPHRVT
jgi:hypothetical protein